jgi:hypothetical protein
VTQFRRVWSRRVWALCAIGVALLLAGCRVDARVDITLDDDGSGTVRTTLVFDRDAMSRLGGAQKATRQFPLDDLRAAGWEVSAFVRRPKNTTTLTLTHDFQGQAELERLLADLVGEKGALREARITRDRGWFRAHDDMSLVVDMRAPASGIGSDEDLRARLRAAGLDPDALDKQLSAELRDSLHVTVALHLPGGTERVYDATTGTIATVSASRSHTDYDRMVKLGIAVALAVLALLFLSAASVSARRRRRRRRRGARRPRTEPPIETERAPTM